jgi:hypothetical protein
LGNNISVKLLYYRPIIPLICELLEFPDFVRALNYKYFKTPPPPPPDGADEDEFCYEDVSDGRNFKKHMNEMDENFIKNEEKYESTLIKINLLISQFYDGIQVFHKRYKSFWPLMITILNLPPSIRNKIGVGMFLITMFSGVQGTPAENYMFDKCFVEELKMLQEGLIIYCREKYFFVQVRLIYHCVDTKALGKLIKTHEANSLMGCPFCEIGKGSKRAKLDKVVYPGHRILLHDNHLLRYFGKSQVCCPPSYYAQEIVFLEECETIEQDSRHLFHAQYLHLKKKMESLEIFEFSERLLPQIVYSGSCEVENKTKAQYEAIRKNTNQFYVNRDEAYMWYHEHFAPTLFTEYLQFVHCDLRKQISNTRISNDQYVANGLEAEELNSNKRVKKEFAVDGVKGICPFCELSYFDYATDICYDPFHVFMDFGKHLFDLLKSSVNPKTEKFCMQNNTHSFLWPRPEEDKNKEEKKKKKKKKKKDEKKEFKKSPYNIPTKSEQMTLEAWVSAILVPITHSKSFQARHIMSETGYLNGSTFIAMFTTTINYINLALTNSVSNEYKDFFSMIGSDIIDLLSFSISDKNIDYLEKQIIESICVHEAMFSEAECSFMVHEIIHIAPHIKQMGPVKGWWTYSGERAMHFVKKNIKTSGQSFEKNAMHKYNNHELVRTRDFYSGKSKKNGLKMESSLFTNQISKTIIYDNFPCKLFNLRSEHKPMKFTSHEMNLLLESLLGEVLKKCKDNNEKAIEESTLFRLFTLFKKYKFPRKSDDNTFYNWILILYDLLHFIDSSTSSISRVSSRSKFGDDLSEFANAKNVLIDRIDFIELKDTIVAFVELYNKIEIYQNAIIYGERFSARGFDFRECFEPKMQIAYGRNTKLLGYMPKLECNELSKYENWKAKRQYSCWCKFKDPLNKSSGYTYNYGQLNYFFRIKCVRDKILHGLPIANLVCRTFKPFYKVDKIDCTEFASMNSSKHPQFVPLTNIFASPILIAPFDIAQKPIIIDKRKFKKVTIQYCSTTNVIDHAFLFDLFPYKTKYILYDPLKNYNTFDDLDENNNIIIDDDEEEEEEEIGE